MAQRLNLTINSIKVFGERHCGTNAIGYFAGKNFNLKLHHHDFLGWKHRLAPQKDEWSKFNVQNYVNDMKKHYDDLNNKKNYNR